MRRQTKHRSNREFAAAVLINAVLIIAGITMAFEVLSMSGQVSSGQYSSTKQQLFEGAAAGSGSFSSPVLASVLSFVLPLILACVLLVWAKGGKAGFRRDRNGR